MAKASDLRRMALQLEGTTEAPHFDRAAFKVARIYVTLAAGQQDREFQVHARRAGAQMPAGAEGFCADPERLGQAGLDHRDVVRVERGRSGTHSRWRGRMRCPKRNRAGGGRRPDNPDRP